MVGVDGCKLCIKHENLHTGVFLYNKLKSKGVPLLKFGFAAYLLHICCIPAEKAAYQIIGKRWLSFA